VSLEISPRRLKGGLWTDGYALHVHILSSRFIGYNEYGHPQFDSLRSPVGELLYQLKYRNDASAVDRLAEAAAEFLKKWNPPIEGIVPVPPSLSRKSQPVIAIAKALAERAGIPLWASCLSKVKQTPQLKDILEYDKRTEALKDAFSVISSESIGKTILLFDDLFGSGATVSHIVEVMKTQGRANAVYLLTLTTK
jgi:competence protein ComFC